MKWLQGMSSQKGRQAWHFHGIFPSLNELFGPRGVSNPQKITERAFPLGVFGRSFVWPIFIPSWCFETTYLLVTPDQPISVGAHFFVVMFRIFFSGILQHFFSVETNAKSLCFRVWKPVFSFAGFLDKFEGHLKWPIGSIPSKNDKLYRTVCPMVLLATTRITPIYRYLICRRSMANQNASYPAVSLSGEFSAIFGLLKWKHNSCLFRCGRGHPVIWRGCVFFGVAWFGCGDYPLPGFQWQMKVYRTPLLNM